MDVQKRDRLLSGVTAATTVGVAVCVGGLLTADLPAVPLSGPVWAAAGSLGFVLLGVISLVRAPGRFSTVTVGALVLCAAGDVLGPRSFHAGLAAFLFAHVAFAAAFAGEGIDPRRARFAVAGIVLASTAASAWLLPHVSPAERVPVVAYIVAISAMVAAVVSTRLPRPGLPIAAAILFYLSDLAVARWRFVSPGRENAFLCYPLYYAACVLFAITPGCRGRRKA